MYIDFPSIEHTLKYCVRNSGNGLFLEFGVYNGGTINVIAANTKNKVYGFDSFEGLPEDWRKGFPKGMFKIKRLPKVAPNVELVVGLFADTLPTFLSTHDGNCAFVHIDCDLYSSAHTVLSLLRDRLVTGTIIVFDELVGYDGWERGEWLALLESGIEYDSLGGCGQQVAIIVK